MSPLFFVLLALHLGAVLVAYGANLLIPFQAERAAGKGGRLFRVERLVAERLSLPAALTVPFTGAGMVLVAGINPTTRFWLWGSIVLYLGTLVYLVWRQRPGVLRLLRGDRSVGLVQQLRLASAGVLAAILVIGAMMMTKPG
jgi:hypothetical protein